MKEKIIAVYLTMLFIVSLVVFVYNLDSDNDNTNIVNNSISPSVLMHNFEKRQLGDGIAVVHLYGPISTQSQAGILGIPQGGADSVVRRLLDLSRDDRVKAVVLRINSPGGTVGASQEINAAVSKLREAGKPVVASVADMAASGGYYSAVAATEIYANKGSLVGSIGVIMSLPPGVQGLMKWAKLDTKGRVFTSGKFKDIGSVYRDMLPEESTLLQNLINNTYQQFLAAVINGRKNMKPNEVRKVAQGQIYTGVQALENGLIDHIGTFDDAVLRAGALGGIKGRPRVIPAKINQLSMFFEQLSMKFLNISNPVKASLQEATAFRLEYRFQPGLFK